MSSPSSRRVVVVGGGILGVSTATRLVRAGEAVVLVTARELTSGASGRSLSWLNSAGVRREAYHRLRLAGIDRYRTLAAAQPDRNWLRFDGGLRWANTPAELRTVHEHEVGHGYDSELIRPDQVPPRAPGVDPSAVPP